MWANFSAMPSLLKFLTAHSLASFVLLVASVVPNSSFAIDGHPVSYSEWWSSGAGPLASLLGVILPISGYLLLKGHPMARVTYLASISIALIGSLLVLHQAVVAAFGKPMVAFAMWYLYRRSDVVAYLASNNHWRAS